MIPLGILALLSIPLYGIFPDQHVHPYDRNGTPEQKAFLALRRSRYRRLGFRRRIRRAIKSIWVVRLYDDP
jgi:hypothetical protein